jgi:hypothetical protein
MSPQPQVIPSLRLQSFRSGKRGLGHQIRRGAFEDDAAAVVAGWVNRDQMSPS